MEYKKINDKYIVRIDKGEEVLKSLINLCKNENVTVGSITGLGATDNVTVGLYNTITKEYNKTNLTGPMEITSLIGNISTKDNEPYLHLHINISNEKCEVKGGHLNECYISATCELIVTSLNGTIERKFDEEIGLNLYKF